MRALADRNPFSAGLNRKGKKQILVSKKCPCEIQIGINWYKLVRKENQLEGLSEVRLPLLDLLLKFPFFGFSVQ